MGTGSGFGPLLGSEFRRLLSRRLLRFLVLAVVGTIAVVCVMVAVDSKPSRPFELVALSDVLLGTALPFAILALFVGATSIGAEWHAGTMTTLLTWEPRRIRVGIAKAIACAVITFVTILALQAFVGGALALIATTRGVTDGADGSWVAVTAGIGLRAATIAAAMSLVGYALASIGRNTAAALGVGFAYFAVAEGLIRGLRPQWQPWLVGENSAAFILGDPSLPIGRSPSASGLLVGTYAIVALAIAIGVFRARDVS